VAKVPAAQQWLRPRYFLLDLQRPRHVRGIDGLLDRRFIEVDWVLSDSIFATLISKEDMVAARFMMVTVRTGPHTVTPPLFAGYRLPERRGGIHGLL